MPLVKFPYKYTKRMILIDLLKFIPWLLLKVVPQKCKRYLLYQIAFQTKTKWTGLCIPIVFTSPWHHSLFGGHIGRVRLFVFETNWVRFSLFCKSLLPLYTTSRERWRMPSFYFAIWRYSTGFLLPWFHIQNRKNQSTRDIADCQSVNVSPIVTDAHFQVIFALLWCC